MRLRSASKLFLAFALACASPDGSTSNEVVTPNDVEVPVDTASPPDTSGPEDIEEPAELPIPDTDEPPPESPWTLERLSTSDTLRAIWGPGDGTYVAVGDRGAVVVNNGATWAPVSRLTAKDLHGVHGLPAGAANHPAEAWVVGDDGAVLRRDAAGWNRLVSGVTDSLRDVAAVSRDEVYIVGLEGRILRFDGASFQTELSNTLSDLFAVVVPDGAAPMAAGSGGRAFKRQGGAWIQLQAAGPTVELRDLFATSGKFVVAVGTEGNILVSTGGGFGLQVSNDVDLHALSGVYGVSDKSVVCVGDEGTVIEYDGDKWTVVPAEGPLYSATTWNDVAGHSAGDERVAYAVGESGAILRYDGSLWRDERSGPDVALRAVAPTVEGGLLAVGEAGLAVAWRAGHGWSATELGTREDLNGVARDGVRLLAVGGGGMVLAVGDGFSATLLESPTTKELQAVSSNGGTALAVGDAGAAVIIDGLEVASENPGVIVDLLGVAMRPDGSALVVGRAGTVLERSAAGSWTARDVPTSVDLHAVTFTASGAIVVGDHGTVLEPDGEGWRRAFEAPGMFLYGVVDSPKGAVAVGWAGRTIRRTEAGWGEELGATANVLEGVSTTNDGEAVAVGHQGTVVRW